MKKRKRETHTPFSIIEAVVRARTKDRGEWSILVGVPRPYYPRQIAPHAHPHQLRRRVIKYSDNFVFINLASILAVNCLNLI